MKLTLITLVSFLAIFIIACTPFDTKELVYEQFPNVVFILADDVGYADLGVYGGKMPTPNIDKLARQGMRFMDAHSPAALCAPSRFSLLTGSYPYRNGRPGGSWDVNNSSGFSFNGDKTKAGRHITVGEVMQQAGYHTAFIGKVHLGGDVYNKKGELIRDKAKLNTMDFSQGVDDSISQHGFDYSLGLQSGIQHEPYAYFENGKFTPVNPSNPADNSSTRLLTDGVYQIGNNGVSEIVEAKTIPARGDIDYDSSQAGIVLSNKAVQFIDRHLDDNRKSGKQRPFLLYYSSQAIHVPHTPPLYFDDKPVSGVTGGVTSDMLYELDLQVGKIIAKLESEAIADNTLIIFTSDNGALWPNVTQYGNPEHDNNGSLRGYKASAYEGGHRVPFIAKWGDGTEQGSRIKPNSISDELIIGHDWVATMYELTRQDMQDDQALDSVSLLSVLENRKDKREALHDFVLYQAGFSREGAIREGDLVLFINEKKQATALYDLSVDLAQKQNLIDVQKFQNIIDQLTNKFLIHNDRDDSTFNEPRTTKPFRAR